MNLTRFTDRSRKAIQAARSEAQRFGHFPAGPEHLLLGLAKDASGVAGAVLKNFSADLRTIRLAVADICPPTDDRPPVDMPLSRQAETACLWAMEEARLMKHNYVGTEHLLLGLLGESPVPEVLLKCGVTPEAIREEIGRLLNPPEHNAEEIVGELAKMLGCNKTDVVSLVSKMASELQCFRSALSKFAEQQMRESP